MFFPSHDDLDPQVNTSKNTSWGVDAASASLALQKQRQFFQDVDRYHREAKYVAAKNSSSKRSREYDEALAKAVGKLPSTYTRSGTVVVKAAFFLLQEGLLDIPDIGCINVKQARALLWNAAWLQEYMNVIWESDHVSPAAKKPSKARKAFRNFRLAIVGPGGTGKTAMLKVTEALTTFFLGPDIVQKMAPSNAAARLFGGDTIHAACKLPFGNKGLSSKKGRLTKAALTNLRKRWATTVAAYIDEVSMIPADQFLQCDVRMRQAKMTPQQPFGGLAINVCGDFLQLPPVDTDGSKPSLANPPAHEVAFVHNSGGEEKETAKDTNAESRQGFRLWRSIRRVVGLDVNVRAPDALGRLQSEMRSGTIPDIMWDLYLSRVLQCEDPRLSLSPFSETQSIHRSQASNQSYEII